MGKTYLVTSSTDGIGRSIVEKILQSFNDTSDRVIVNYGHNDEKAHAFMEENKKYKNHIILLKADLSTYEGLLSFIEMIKEKVSSLDYIVCNTGIGTYSKFEDYTWDIWNKIITTNLSIPAFLIKELKPMLQINGSILFVGSDAGIKSYSSSVVYSVSKAGLIHLSRVLVKELEPLSIRCNAIAPGFIETSWQNGRSEESYSRICKKIALHRFGTAKEIAEMAYSVLHNAYMNGSVVEIHGGYEYF